MTRAAEWTWFAVRAFLGTGVPFGLVVGLVVTSAVSGVEAGAAFGVIMTAVFASMTVRSGRRQGRVDLTTHYRAQIQLAEARDLQPRLRAAIEALPATIVSDDSHVLRARTGVTMRSWGETITVAHDSSTSTLSVESRPRLRSTLADYGRNRDNVERIVAALSSPSLTAL